MTEPACTILLPMRERAGARSSAVSWLQIMLSTKVRADAGAHKGAPARYCHTISCPVLFGCGRPARDLSFQPRAGEPEKPAYAGPGAFFSTELSVRATPERSSWMAYGTRQTAAHQGPRCRRAVAGNLSDYDIHQRNREDIPGVFKPGGVRYSRSRPHGTGC